MKYTIRASGSNPFDPSYYPLQHEFDSRVLQLISEISEINISLVRTPLVTNTAAYQKSPNTWVLEQIVNGTAEISAASIILTPDFPEIARYSYDIGTFRPQLYYRATSLRESSNIYLLPFSTNVWLCLIAVVLLLTFALTFILSREAKLPHEISYDVLARIMDTQEDIDDEWIEDLETTSKESLLQREQWEIGEILLVCLGALCQQGAARDPSTSAARLLLLVLFILAVVGYTAYSASVISLISLFPSTEHELMNTLVNFSKEYKVLLHNTNKAHQNLQFGFCSTEFTTLKIGFDRTIQGETVFVGDRDVSLTFLHQQNYSPYQRCMLGRASLGTEYHKVFAFKKNSSFLQIVNNNILKLRQFGLITRERKKLFNIKPPCSVEERSTQANFISFNKKDVEPVINLFILGLVSALILLTIENIIFYCSKRVKELLNLFNIKINKQISSEKNLNVKNISTKNTDLETKLKIENWYFGVGTFHSHQTFLI